MSSSKPSASAGSRSKDQRAARGEADLRSLFALALARTPESRDVVEAFMALPAKAWPGLLFNSEEFDGRVVQALRSGRDPWAGATTPEPDLVEWASRTLSLSEPGRGKVARAGWSWPALFLALFEDADFVRTCDAPAMAAPEILATLRAFASARGAIERIDARVVSGWAIGLQDDDGPAHLELWIDGAFAAATVADRFRRDIQDRIGGDGHCGFIVQIPSLSAAVPDALVEVRTAGVHGLLGARRVSLEGPSIDAIAACRDEIRQLKAAVERLESLLPIAVSDAGGAAIQDWAVYHDAWYGGLDAERPVDGDWAAILDGVDVEPRALQASVEAFVGQARRGDRLILIAAKGERAMADDLARQAGASGAAEVEVLATSERDPGDRATAALARVGQRALTLLLHGGDVLDPAALACLTRRFAARRATVAIYADEDRLDPTGPEGEGRRRHLPMLKTGVDPDLFLQTPYVGRTLAFRSEALAEAGLQRGRDGFHGPEAMLSLADTPEAVDHLALVLVTRTTPDPDPERQAAAWSSVVADRLAATGQTAEIRPHDDILGAKQPGALRLKRPPPAVRATVVITTRDRTDLLAACIDSLKTHRAANTTAMDLIVVDHESREPQTLAYLDELRAEGTSVLPFSGPFNWALMNNLAASHARGDVLVFLNNDTVVLSPDWLDALTAQAMREEVGVVGARLIYSDGTLQHAGFVARGQGPGFLVHDGVGEAGSSGGYLGRHALMHASPVVTGACLAVRASVFNALGGFDAASFPVEGNDADLCFRARAAGLRVLYDPNVTLYHLESKSRGFSTSGEKQMKAAAADRLLRDRWGARFGEDAGFNPHFDRSGRPFSRLRPLPQQRD